MIESKYLKSPDVVKNKISLAGGYPGIKPARKVLIKTMHEEGPWYKWIPIQWEIANEINGKIQEKLSGRENR